jgi:subtilisin family serine protease
MPVGATLKAFGVAQVLVTLKDVPPGNSAALTEATSDLRSITKHFRQSQNSRSGAVAMAMAARRLPTPYKVYKNLGLVLGTVDEAGYKALKQHSAVKAVTEAPELSLIRPVAAAEETGPTKGPTWGITRLKVDKLWEKGLTGQGVLIGHLDTGVDGKHPALKNAIAQFAEFDDMGERVPDAEPHDTDTHGTHTAGTIAGRAVKGSQFGVAPGAKLASGIVIEGGNVIARILAGMDWVVGEGAKILSMSLGLRGFHEDFLPLIQAIRNRGILPVIAVGNEGPGTSRSAGNYDIVLSVGAGGEDERVADFSSSQKFDRTVDPFVPDLVAPGVEVLSSLPGSKFGTLNGTSMATPHIAGLAALLWQAKPGATVAEIESAIFGSCKRPSKMNEVRANRGVPDAVDALARLLASPTLSASKRRRRTSKKTAAKASPRRTSKKTAAKAKRKKASKKR